MIKEEQGSVRDFACPALKGAWRRRLPVHIICSQCTIRLASDFDNYVLGSPGKGIWESLGKGFEPRRTGSPYLSSDRRDSKMLILS